MLTFAPSVLVLQPAGPAAAAVHSLLGGLDCPHRGASPQVRGFVGRQRGAFAKGLAARPAALGSSLSLAHAIRVLSFVAFPGRMHCCSLSGPTCMSELPIPS